MYEQHIKKNMKPECSASMTIKAINMTYGWCHMVNNTVHYYQNHYNIALIIEQLSNYNSVLREQIEMEGMRSNKTTRVAT